MWNLRGRSWWILNLMQCCSSSPSPWIQTYPPSKRASCVIQAYQKSSGRRAPPRLPMQHPLWKFEKRVEIQERITDDVHTKSEANNSLYRASERIFFVIYFLFWFIVSLTHAMHKWGRKHASTHLLSSSLVQSVHFFCEKKKGI